ncbi:MAG TPA: hypothetical protein VFF73_38460 [Planctomycetota bacterium]|nr:hypothetical protein [Planctomycetota bacterium]
MTATKDNPTLLAQILIERYGLDGRPPRSVAEVAEQHGISRLSVRTLEGPLVKRISKVLARERQRKQLAS